MLKLPVEFKSSASASGDFQKVWAIQSGALEAECAVPAEFGGKGGGFSPEDLYLQALINCFIGTFKVYAKASKIDFGNLAVFGALTVDRNENGAVRMQKCELEIELNGVLSEGRVKTLVEKVFRDGFILNSVKTEIVYQLKITENQNA